MNDAKHPTTEDARLIAEASNLLAACKLMVELLEDEEEDPEWRAQVIASAKRAIFRAQEPGSWPEYYGGPMQEPPA